MCNTDLYSLEHTSINLHLIRKRVSYDEACMLQSPPLRFNRMKYFLVKFLLLLTLRRRQFIIHMKRIMKPKSSPQCSLHTFYLKVIIRAAIETTSFTEQTNAVGGSIFISLSYINHLSLSSSLDLLLIIIAQVERTIECIKNSYTCNRTSIVTDPKWTVFVDDYVATLTCFKISYVTGSMCPQA